MADPPKKLKSGNNPLAEVDDGLTKNYQRKSPELIYETVMRSGGEPFGAPLELGVPTLTEKIVKLFNLNGFFGFETVERARKHNRRNKFTRHGASNYLGPVRSGRPRPGAAKKKK